MAVQKCDECGKSSQELHTTYKNRELLLGYWYCNKCFKRMFPEIEERIKGIDSEIGREDE